MQVLDVVKFCRVHPEMEVRVRYTAVPLCSPTDSNTMQYLHVKILGKTHKREYYFSDLEVRALRGVDLLEEMMVVQKEFPR